MGPGGTVGCPMPFILPFPPPPPPLASVLSALRGRTNEDIVIRIQGLWNPRDKCSCSYSGHTSSWRNCHRCNRRLQLWWNKFYSIPWGPCWSSSASPLAGFNTPASTKPPSLLTQTLGTAKTTAGGGFSFGGAATPAATSTAAPSLLGTPATGGLLGSGTSGGLGTGTLGATPGTTLGSGGGNLFGSASAAKPQATTGFSLGATTTTAGATGLTLPGLGGIKPSTTTAAAAPTGFNFGAKTTAAGTTAGTTAGFGGLGGVGLGGKTTTGLGGATTGLGGATTGLGGATTGLGGIGATGVGGTGTSVFSNIPTKPQTSGLGGVDPKTSQAATGDTAADAKPG
ncbi:uncharacterized protein [Argopecten irradians]|uniref:uncharacterized protein n=1 Tax=Argopecten irradians TaxID=31199 RepID=UPI0037105E61